MSGRIDKTELIKKLRDLEGLTDEEKSNLIGLLRQHKKYGLVWEDKQEDVEERLREELPVLTEVKERRIISDAPDAPNHILIEGDNLEALTALSYTHEGKIDVIYIDPPYNTGNKDFVYNDAYVDTEDAYRHSKWLSFMSKRLRIAKRLLSDKGVIFISIDDNEQANLKLLCDEVFGDRNFIGELILKTATDNNPSQINTEHEYMLCFAKSKVEQGNWERTSSGAKLIIQKYRELKTEHDSIETIQKELRKWIKASKESLPQVAHYNNVDEKGVYSSSSNSSNPHPGGYTYDIIHPVTGKPCPKPQNGWRWPMSTFQQYDEAGEIEWGKDETTQPHVKKRIETSTEYLRTLIYEDNRGTTKALADIFCGEKVFDNPKPTTVLSRVLDFSSSKDSIILDFFAGSGTTLHATMQLNAEDGGHRKCILVTNNENQICENVTYERNKRVIQGYTTPKGQKVEGLKDNNLRYYRTDFIPRERTQRNMRALVNAATDLLCVKEDLYQELSVDSLQLSVKLKAKHVRLFGDGKRSMMVIYDEQAIPYIVEGLLKGTTKNTKITKDDNDFGFFGSFDVNNKIKVYVFSPGRYAFDDEFYEVQDKVQLVALPAAIYDAYQRVLPKQKERLLDEAEEPAPQPSASAMTIDFEEGGEQ